MTRDATIEPKP